MKISYTSHHYYPHTGGTEKVVRSSVESAASLGHEVHVFSDHGDLSSLKDTDRIHYHGISLKRVGKFRFPPSSYWKDLSSTDSDIFHIHGQRVWSSDYLYWHLKDLHGKKIFTAHGFYQMIYGGIANSLYYNQFMPSFLDKFDRIICLTEYEKAITEKISPSLSKKIDVVPDPVDFHKIVINENPEETLTKYSVAKNNYFIHSGGLQKNKNIEFIVRAIKGTGMPLLLTGNTPDKGYENSIRQTGLDNSVEIKFLGNVPESDLYTLMANSNAFLFASRFESFGVAMVEAAYSGARVICTDIGISGELGREGIVKIVNSAATMREAVDNYKVDLELNKIRESLIKRFSTENVMRRIMEVYES